MKPNLTLLSLFNLSFGFFGVQIAYALQSANISRIFATLGADPHSLSYFWVLPPLMGMIVQPIVGTLSDRTWTRFGRRIPYLFVGSAVAVAVMCLLPNAGSLGLDNSGTLVLTFTAAMLFGLIMLMLLDTSLNMAMQPFKMMVGDMVGEQQKARAYSIQSLLCNAGSVVGFLLPILFTQVIGLRNTAEKGVVPESVVWAFYVGAAILILCVLYTTANVKEWPPEKYLRLNPSPKEEHTPSWLTLLASAPATFYKVGLVQLFCWAAFMYMWSYVNGAVSETVWSTTDAHSQAYQDAGDWVGLLYAVQAIGSVVWALVLPTFKSTKVAYATSLLIGGIGFMLIPLMPDKYLQFIPFLMIGAAWAAMLAMPFAFVTNALQGHGHMGAYLGLFNCTICLPQILAALLGGTLLTLVGGTQSAMMYVAGALLVVGAALVPAIKR